MQLTPRYEVLSWRCFTALFNEAYLLVDPLQDRLLLLVEDGLVLLDKVLAFGVDRDDQRTELPDAIDPKGLWHTQVGPLGRFDLLDLRGGQYGAAARKDGVHSLVLQTSLLSLAVSSCSPKSGSAAGAGSDGLPCQIVFPAFPHGAKPIGGYSFTPMNPLVSMARFTIRMLSPTPLLSRLMTSRGGQNDTKPWTRPPMSTDTWDMTST